MLTALFAGRSATGGYSLLATGKDTDVAHSHTLAIGDSLIQV
jgi:hypothetical protein